MNFSRQLEQKRVVVTGATGFIGGDVMSALLKTGADITVILRSKHGRDRFKQFGITVVTSGLDDASALNEALQSADVLFNLAYDVRASGEANLSAFSNLLTAAKAAEVKRIVHTSSIVVYDDWPNGVLTENAPVSTRSGGTYRQTKIEMEKRLKDSGIPTAILQPTLVYGPKSALWTERIINQLKTGPIVLPEETGLCNAVYVSDVAQAALRAAVVDDLLFETFIISGSEPIGWDEFYTGYQGLVGGSELRRVPLKDLQDRLGPVTASSEAANGPTVAARLSSQLRGLVGNDRFEKLVGKAKRLKSNGKPIHPDRNGLELLAANGVCDISKARAQLGYEPAFDFQAGLREIAAFTK